MSAAVVYLIPTVLHEGAVETIPAYVLAAIKECKVLFVEHERTARRFLKLLWKEADINSYEWHNIKDSTPDVLSAFTTALRTYAVIGIMSEAGCPGVADPGQHLIAIAQKEHATVKPLVGPNSILLALMASGMNGQQFQFVGYLPIENEQKISVIKRLEAESAQKNLTQIFIETPYRNNHLATVLTKTCKPHTLLCIASQLTSGEEFVKTNTIQAWRSSLPDLHRKATIFLLYCGV
jgi:16S rRNA (cytidine1402-2'-O)-methyltransferase